MLAKLLGLDKYIVYLVAGLVGLTSITGGILLWKNSIKKQAQIEFNNKQLEQVVKDQQVRIDQLMKINEAQEQIITHMTAQNEELRVSLKNLDEFLNSDETRKHGSGASEILKRTIKELEKIKNDN